MAASGILSFVKASKKRASSRSGKRRTKAAYRIRNWSEYNMALIGRGSLTLWFSPDVLSCWLCPTPTGKPGASPIYSDLAIVTVLTLGAVFHLPLRQQQGFAQSLLHLLQPDLPVPNYTTLCRRRQTLAVEVPASASLRRAEGVHLVVDSTGLKIYGEGEWKVRLHGKGKRRTWRKLHLGVDEATHEILSAELTLASVGDGQMLPKLLEQTEQSGVRIAQVSGDGSYDSWACHEAIAARGAMATIPVRRGSKIRQRAKCAFPAFAPPPTSRGYPDTAATAAGRQSGLETGERLSPAQFGGNGHVSAKADLRGRFRRASSGQPKTGSLCSMCCLEPNDTVGNAGFVPRVRTDVCLNRGRQTKRGSRDVRLTDVT